MLSIKLKTRETFVTSENVSVRLVNTCEDVLFGIIFEVFISLVVLNPIVCKDSCEKKYIGLMTYMIILSLLVPCEIYSGSSNVT